MFLKNKIAQNLTFWRVKLKNRANQICAAGEKNRANKNCAACEKIWGKQK